MRTILVGMAVFCGWVSPAAAGGYVAVGVGTEASLDGELSEHFDTEDLTLGRVALGWRLGPVAAEAVMFGTDLQGMSMYVRDQSTGELDFSTISFGADLKYFLAVRGPFEAYVRAGLNKTWLRTRDDTDSMLEHEGGGYDLGIGLQWALGFVPKVNMGLWVDYNRHVLDLEDPTGPTLSGKAEMITFGISLGSL